MTKNRFLPEGIVGAAVKGLAKVASPVTSAAVSALDKKEESALNEWIPKEKWKKMSPKDQKAHLAKLKSRSKKKNEEWKPGDKIELKKDKPANPNSVGNRFLKGFKEDASTDLICPYCSGTAEALGYQNAAGEWMHKCLQCGEKVTGMEGPGASLITRKTVGVSPDSGDRKVSNESRFRKLRNKVNEEAPMTRELLEKIDPLVLEQVLREVSLSKKHYVAVAKILRDSATKEEVHHNLAKYFGQDNPKFNHDKFHRASGTPGHVQKHESLNEKSFKGLGKRLRSKARKAATVLGGAAIGHTVGAAAGPVGAAVGAAAGAIAGRRFNLRRRRRRNEDVTTADIGAGPAQGFKAVSDDSGYVVRIQQDIDQTYAIVLDYGSGDVTYLESGIVSEEEANNLLSEYQQMYGGGENYQAESTMPKSKFDAKSLIESVARGGDLDKGLALFLGEDQDVEVPTGQAADPASVEIDPNAEADTDEQDVEAHPTPDGAGASQDAPQGTLPEQDPRDNSAMAAQAMAAGDPADEEFMAEARRLFGPRIREQLAKSLGLSEAEVKALYRKEEEGEKPAFLQGKDDDDKDDDEGSEDKGGDDDSDDSDSDDSDSGSDEGSDDKGEEDKNESFQNSVVGQRYAAIMGPAFYAQSEARPNPAPRTQRESISDTYMAASRALREMEGDGIGVPDSEEAEHPGATPAAEIGPAQSAENTTDASLPVKEARKGKKSLSNESRFRRLRRRAVEAEGDEELPSGKQDNIPDGMPEPDPAQDAESELNKSDAEIDSLASLEDEGSDGDKMSFNMPPDGPGDDDVAPNSEQGDSEDPDAASPDSDEAPEPGAADGGDDAGEDEGGYDDEEEEDDKPEPKNEESFEDFVDPIKRKDDVDSKVEGRRRPVKRGFNEGLIDNQLQSGAQVQAAGVNAVPSGTPGEVVLIMPSSEGFLYLVNFSGLAHGTLCKASELVVV